MSFSYTYTELFSIKLFHDYFLDLGISKFYRMNTREREKQLSQFDWSLYLDIQPTSETQKKLADQRMRVFRDQSTFRVLISVQEEAPDQPFIMIPPDLQLDFLVRSTDPYFTQYSTIKVNPENIFWLANSESEVPLIPLYVPPEEPEPDPEETTYLNRVIEDDYLLSEERTLHMKKQYGVTQKDSIIGIISIRLSVPDEEYRIVKYETTEEPEPKTICLIEGKQFYIRFENSEYIWRYQRKDIQEHYSTLQKRPLVKNGFVDIPHSELHPPPPPEYVLPNMKLPNPQVGSLREEVVEDEKRIYSIIYI